MLVILSPGFLHWCVSGWGFIVARLSHKLVSNFSKIKTSLPSVYRSSLIMNKPLPPVFWGRIEFPNDSLHIRETSIIFSVSGVWFHCSREILLEHGRVANFHCRMMMFHYHYILLFSSNSTSFLFWYIILLFVWFYFKNPVFI